tara:strand:+ start:1779 stop:2558 length:780 start_codon:yes stop_codon:yes gene_type:complete
MLGQWELGVWSYTLLSVIVVSLISFVGVITLSMKKKVLEKVLILLVSLSAGVLLGDVFLHLIPEASQGGLDLQVSLMILVGIVVFFILEKIVCWRHCHVGHPKHQVHPYAVMNLIGDGLHNFIDGLVIAGSYLVDIRLGIATTVAVLLHEIPQEIGDFGVLLHGGFKKSKAIMFNFLTAFTAVIGAVVALVMSQSVMALPAYIIPFTAGGFIYIAASDLIPQIHHHHKKSVKVRESLLELLVFVFGIALMYGLLFLELA